MPTCRAQRALQSSSAIEDTLSCSSLSRFQGICASVGTHQCHVQVTELLNSCTFAARMPADEIGLHQPLSAFRGQMGAVYVFDDVLSGGSTPLQPIRQRSAVQGHVVMPAGQLTGPHIHSLTASCRVLVACAAGAQADPWKEKRVPSLSIACVMLQRKSQPCTPWGLTTSLHSPPLRRMRLWSRSRQPQRWSQTARTRLRAACCSATMHRWLSWAFGT